MNPSAPVDSETETSSPVGTSVEHEHSQPTHGHPDPITGEADAHPVGVGVGATAAGAAGAAIGALLGPVGVVIGAAFGAIAGGLAGKEIATGNHAPTAEAPNDAPVGEELTSLSEPGVADYPGAYAANQAQIASPGFDRLSRDVGYRDAHAIEAQTASAIPRDVVPVPYIVAEPGDKEYATTQRGGEIPASAIAEPPVPTVGDNPYSISDSPLAAEAIKPADLVFGNSRSGGTTEPAVREAAYYKYLGRERVGMPGDAVSDWLAAEHDVSRE